MRSAILAISFAGVFLGAPAAGQQPEVNSPLYRVTVIERTTPAINYLYRSGATKIDFRGTVLLPEAKGEATVESKQGRTEVDAEIERMIPPQRFGLEYLTYVLWAITPQGRPQNLGQLVLNSSNRAGIHVTTGLQAFALIVTAEPYSAVRQPSDVVVLENQVRADTTGRVQTLQAKYDLLPRGGYTLQNPSTLNTAAASGPKVSAREYETLLELYEAQNAIYYATSARAEQYAPDTFQRAKTLLEEARRLNDSRGDRRRVVEIAREATQTAEDARMLAQVRRQEQELAQARAEAASGTETSRP
jgi:hypothetical protein